MPNAVRTDRENVPTSPPWSTDCVGTAAALACAMVTWVCTVRLAGLDLRVRLGAETQAVGVVGIALATVVIAVVGFGVLRILERLVPRALELWTALAVGTTLLSMLGPLAATSTPAAGALAALHGVVAAVVIASGIGSRRRRGAGREPS